jgi:polysaccharide pyruvyl transferase WcaK-like protein
MNVTLIDPSIRRRNLPSINLGDVIIGKSVLSELNSLFPHARIWRVSSHQRISLWRCFHILRSKHIIIGGTNILSSDTDAYNQWKIGKLGALMLRGAVLMGAGWWQYQPPAAECSRAFYRKVLSASCAHSLRDGYSLGRFQDMGRWRAVNTGCPTMWSLAHKIVNNRRANKIVLATLTDYKPNPTDDKMLLRFLATHYERVFVWPQGSNDAAYIESLGEKNTLLEHSFESLVTFLEANPSADYVGTRLHCGIYCLNKGHRSMILSVDNRATEIAKDTRLPVIPRGDLEALKSWLREPKPVLIAIDRRAVDKWRSEFQRHYD